MSQSRKKRTDKSMQEAETTKAVAKKQKAEITKEAAKEQRGRWTGLIIASVVIAIILIIAGFFYYQEYVAPYRTTIVIVDDTSIRMDYFIKRIKISGADPMTMLDTIWKEQIIKLDAPKYVGELTEEDIERQLRQIASGGSGNITESEFREWYRQQLNETGLSDAELRDHIGTALLATRLEEYLEERMPTVAEQIHVHMIMVETYEDAEKARTRWEEGEDFADLAREVSLDEESRENGGDLGWMPEGVDEFVDYIAFDLSIGEVSKPASYTGEYFNLFMVSEREVARTIEEEDLQVLKNKVLDTWLNAKSKEHTVEFHGFSNGFDSETYYWINMQLAKEASQSQ